MEVEMVVPIETVKDLCAALEKSDGAADLKMVADQRALAAGFHVTEVSKAEVKSLDCGGRQLAWNEAAIQILDSGSGRPMRIGTLRNILDKAQTALMGLSDLPLKVDADPGGIGLRRFSIAAVHVAPEAVTVSLTPQHAACKPAAEASKAQVHDCRSVGCCT